MSLPPEHPKDPFVWSAVLTLAFLGLVSIRLTIPSTLYFDEVHYLPAARHLLELSEPVNREHPLVGKEFIALGIALFGDGPLGWRIFPALFGTLALFAFMRALWFASQSRFATLAGGVLVATGFALFIHARIAMLDVFMFAFTMVALWQVAAAVREPERARLRLATGGIALGLAMGSKWNAIPVAVLPGLTFLACRLWSAKADFLSAKRGPPIPGMSLMEAFVWLGIVPLATYAASFAPAWFYAVRPMGEIGFLTYQGDMLSLQTQVLKDHPYASTWREWIVNARAIWYLYENVDGAQRGVVLLGNPLTVLAGLPAMAWCLWAGIAHKRRDAFAVFALYAASLGFWMVAAKSVQFYYHYFLPSAFLMAGLALALEEIWRRKSRAVPLVVLGAAVVLFAWFYPIISSAALPAPDAFNKWMWYSGWR